MGGRIQQRTYVIQFPRLENKSVNAYILQFTKNVLDTTREKRKKSSIDSIEKQT